MEFFLFCFGVSETGMEAGLILEMLSAKSTNQMTPFRVAAKSNDLAFMFIGTSPIMKCRTTKHSNTFVNSRSVKSFFPKSQSVKSFFKVLKVIYYGPKRVC
jgi:hypothetical protein